MNLSNVFTKSTYLFCAILIGLGTFSCSKDSKTGKGSNSPSQTVSPSPVQTPGAEMGEQEPEMPEAPGEVGEGTFKPQPDRAGEIKIMTYNLENFFDTEHDVVDGQEKNDYAYLPKGYPNKSKLCDEHNSGFYAKQCKQIDWTPDHMALKAAQLGKVIKSVGDLPDLLGVQEIENAVVAKALADEVGYKDFIITSGPDRRGIEVALFYLSDNLTYVNHEEIVLTGRDFESKPTRNILRVTFQVNGTGIIPSLLTVYVNHWPSQSAGPEKRFETAKVLKASVESQKALYGERVHIVAMGDFNTLERETPNAFHNVLIDPNWTGHLVDVQNYPYRYKESRLSQRAGEIEDASAPRSYLYDGLWQALDRFFISQNLFDDDGVEFQRLSFRVVSNGFASRTERIESKKNFRQGSVLTGRAMRYDYLTLDAEKAGYSDHHPVLMKLNIETF